ncbi:hypothetical protein SAMD00019534_101000 [Acytostelium subglobosum LB1]|uniref:hypothetical protein n=1 Tax=Acytostelium subglobosum LB1 TaxID=1410327 RepID=UPI000644C4B9|nr:hypothetical protein SAMD00019534_101000 [Acytostelium subglobosum LB1]GAM26925.1 hypothetical protein SAMD00019534_101000 [Acytostelium subglobosum LB1]|eukprot:XP_012750193.1 hypothetical protein SAMD00019534_101000 [Acytostelium subglobosum LB1]
MNTSATVPVSVPTPPQSNSGKEWTDVTKTCIVLFPFNATHKFQLPLAVGDLVNIYAQTIVDGEQGWFSGVSVATQEHGIFPQSYVAQLPNNIDELSMPHNVPISTKIGATNEQMANCAIFNEITNTIVEWATLLKLFSQNKQHNDFKVLTQRLTQLIQFRTQLLTLSSAKDISFELRDKILTVIDEGRQETGMTVVLRKEMQNTHSNATTNPRNSNTPQSSLSASDLVLADAENTGLYTLYTLYQEKRSGSVDRTLESIKIEEKMGGQSSSGNLQSLAPPSVIVSSSVGGGTSPSNNNSNTTTQVGMVGSPSISRSVISNSSTDLSSQTFQAGTINKTSKTNAFFNFNSVRIKGKSQINTSSGGIGQSMSNSSTNLTVSSTSPPPSMGSPSIYSSSPSSSPSMFSMSQSISTSPMAGSPLTGSPQLIAKEPSHASGLTPSTSPGASSPGPKPAIGGRSSPNPMLNKPHLLPTTKPSRQGSFLVAQQQSSSAAGGPNQSEAAAAKTTTSQLLVSLSNFLYSSGEYLELIFSIYNKTDNKFITENYCGIVPPSGIFVEPDNPNEKLRTVFKDLEAKDLASELYLVAKIYKRTSNINSKDPNNSPTMTRSNAAMIPSISLSAVAATYHQNSGKQFKKYIGCGVKRLDLGAASTEAPVEFMIQLYTSANEAAMPSLHESIINEASSSYEAIVRAKGIVCTFQHFVCDYAQFLGANPTFRNVAASLKMQLPELVLPGNDRNDIYIQIEDGEFADKNIEVALVIKNDAGVVMTDSIKYANGQPTTAEYRTSIQTAGSNASNRWNETVKVWMAAKTLPSAHMFFVARTCSEKRDKERQTIGYGFLRFVGDDGSVLKDGAHTITLVRSPTEDVPVAIYLQSRGDLDNSAGGAGAKASSKKTQDTMRIRTTFVSTTLAQNHHVVNLTNWQTYNGELSALIKDITFLAQQDIIRNLQEIFYNFLAIMDQQLNDSPLSMEIFRAFTFIIGGLVDSRSVNYRPALDLYVSKYFGASMNASLQLVGIAAHTHLLRSVVKSLENFEDPANTSRITLSLKALEYIFKMVVASRTRFPNKVDAEYNNETYLANLKSVVDTLCEIMVSNSPALIGAQTIALKNFEGMFADMRRFFTIEEMGIIALKFMRSIQHLEKNKRYNLLKLRLLISYINGDLMLNKETRKQLHPIVFQLLLTHFGKSFEETDLCLAILGQVSDIMITKVELRGDDKDVWLVDIISFFVQILELLQLINNSVGCALPPADALAQADQRSNSNSSTSSLAGATTSANLLAIVQLLPEDSLHDLRLKIYSIILGTARLAGAPQWEQISKTPTSRTMFIDLFTSLRLLLESPKFPKDFWAFNVFVLKTILRMSRILEDVSFNPTKNGGVPLDLSMLQSFFLLTTAFLNCKDLQTEVGNPAKAVFLKSRCGDVRIEMSRVLERVWAAVPIQQRASFIAILIDPVIRLLVSEIIDAKRVATKIYYDILEGEIVATGAYLDLLNRTVDTLVESGTGVTDGLAWPVVTRGMDAHLPFTHKTFATFFNSQCMQIVLGKSTEDTKKKAEQFIKDIIQFVSLLATFMAEIKNQDDEEVFSAVSKLIQYFKDNRRTSHFIRFVSMCSKRHSANGSFVEAAVVAMMHASLYKWDHHKVIDAIVCDYGPCPIQKESERKEALYKEILAFYNKGKAWDLAIPLLKELTHHYTMNYCDMAATANYLRQQATFIQKLNDTEPALEEYFRVGYYGKRYPINVQNKEFVYKGNDGEKLADFTAKLTTKWPRAELLKSTEPPSQSIMDTDSQYSFGPKRRVPLRIQQLNARCNVNVFVHVKPGYRRPGASAVRPANDLEDSWTLNTYLVCATPFPGTERRSLVVERHQQEVSPIENALNNVVQRNEELISQLDKYTQAQSNGAQENVAPLTATIESAVGGNTAKYEYFLSHNYVQKHPESKHLVECLKVAMDQQLIVLEQALHLHAQLRPVDMAATQERLESSFAAMKNERASSIII